MNGRSIFNQPENSAFCLSVQDRFEQLWQGGGEPNLPYFWQQIPSAEPALLADVRQQLLWRLVEIDLQYRWTASTRIAGGSSPKAGPWPLEEYARLLPELGPIERFPVELIVHEYQLRCANDQSPPSINEYLLRFPNHEAELRGMLKGSTAEANMEITLAVTAGPHSGQSFRFSGHDTFIVGRSLRAHFQLPKKDRYFSRFHFLVEMNPPQCRLIDMKSRNGCYVNGQRVRVSDINDGDVIKAGRTTLLARIGSHERVQPAEGKASQSSRSNQIAGGISTSQVSPLTRPSPAEVRGEGSRARNAWTGNATRSELSSAPIDRPPATCLSTVSWSMSAGHFDQDEPRGACGSCGESAKGPYLDLASGESICNGCLALGDRQFQALSGYRLIRQLGRGGMGIVYLAIAGAAEKLVAIKVIQPAVAGTKLQVQRFLREVSILCQLDHPRIVSFAGMGEVNGTFYFTMAYVRGIDGAALVKKNGPLDTATAIGLICQLLETLEHAHEQGFVHRDIKPSNIMITTANGHDGAMLLDFGLARVYEASKFSGLTLTGAVGGTIGFVAPEQISNFRATTPRADQYGAAATLYYFLTASHLFNLGKSLPEQILAVLQESPMPIRSRRPELPEALANIIHRALAKDPADRFSDVRAMRLALLPFAGAAPTKTQDCC